MSILNIRDAERVATKVIIALAGQTGQGKTYTALQIARGMVSNPSKIGFLDTENGRGSLYSNILDGKFKIGDLYAPFSPKRYSLAIKDFQDAGMEVLIIDSGSHEWEGVGGCDDIANGPKADGTPRKVANWVGAKREHKEFVNTLLYSNMHIIVCLRAREKTDFTITDKPKSLGIQPICEKNFMYEMTASIMVENSGRTQTHIKVPSFLQSAFGDGKDYLGIKTGKAIIDWVNKGEKESPEITKIKSEMLMACEYGLDQVLVIWNKLTADQKKLLNAHKEICKASAEEYDKQAKEADQSPAENLAQRQEGSQLKIDMP